MLLAMQSISMHDGTDEGCVNDDALRALGACELLEELRYAHCSDV